MIKPRPSGLGSISRNAKRSGGPTLEGVGPPDLYNYTLANASGFERQFLSPSLTLRATK